MRQHVFGFKSKIFLNFAPNLAFRQLFRCKITIKIEINKKNR